MDQGEGVEGAALKRDPRDFALWKAAKEGEDTAWDSPWGRGRPGWHIECSAMAESLLGVDFEIHGGGTDLIFPHHENEAAQTAAARGEELARLWVHNGMIRLDQEKMSKSVGNIFLLANALDAYGRDALIVYFLGGHYRQPLEFDEARLEEAAARLARIKDAGRRLAPGDSPEWSAPITDRFFDALANDFNTAKALAEVAAWVTEAFKHPAGTVGDADLREMLGVFALDGVLDAEPPPPEAALELLHAREAARAERDFPTADRIRDELRELGWEVRDGSDGPELIPHER